ncbi:GNAT family N-acetyltransferase [Mesopusillimonas faecipullorum]|nr:GNAT family N-acetyltransferase [Mesopusillimonas faecipullorum]
MQRRDLDVALQWAADEGWNPGLHDADSFYAADSQGFLVGDLNGKPVACISAVRYGSSYAFLGLYIVKPSHRGRGYGKQVMQAALNHLGARVIGLDGVVAQQANYGRLGFTVAHRNIRYQGVAQRLTDESEASNILPLSRLPFASIARYDQVYFPAGRDAFLQAWLMQADAHGFGLIRQAQLVGYGLIRSCRVGYKIGPLFADTPSDAQALLRALMQSVPENSPVFIDIPETNGPAKALASAYDMQPIFETARMYKGDFALPDMACIYGITSLELG